MAELSRLGRNMLQVLNIINDLSGKGVKITFVRQPELSTTGTHGKLLLAIYSYFTEAEREFISMRVKQRFTQLLDTPSGYGWMSANTDWLKVIDAGE